jgi:hypothetical protein
MNRCNLIAGVSSGRLLGTDGQVQGQETDCLEFSEGLCFTFSCSHLRSNTEGTRMSSLLR